VDAFGGKVALVFPGQGSQFVGMGKALYDASAAARRVFDQADEVLGFPLSRLCFHGPAEDLEDTINAQPAILTVSIAALEAMKERMAAAGQKVEPVVVAGHSLGEFTALVAAGVIDFPSGLQLVRERGRLMKEAGEERPGGMAAVIGLDAETLAALCADAADGDVITVANDNCPGQTVISGEIAALLRAMEMAKAKGAKRVARLGISIASHSPLMARASAGLSDILSRLPLHAPQVPVVANVSGLTMRSVEEIRQELAHHVERPVNWTRSVAEMANSGVTTFIEVGPGQVLSGLIRRINRDAITVSLTDLGLPADRREA
jgi:[acyl-carrier-protein] S-malonyltransferase